MIDCTEKVLKIRRQWSVPELNEKIAKLGLLLNYQVMSNGLTEERHPAINPKDVDTNIHGRNTMRTFAESADTYTYCQTTLNVCNSGWCVT